MVEALFPPAERISEIWTDIMTRLALLTAMALLGIGLLLAQNTQSTQPPSDQSNSSNASSQPQSSEPATAGKDQQSGAMPNHRAGREDKGDPSHQGLPDAAVHDDQNSTTSTTGAAGQNNTTPSRSTMGTAGSAEESSAPQQPQTTPLENATPPDQQPNPSTQPNAAAQPHAELMTTPAARAVATHTPDPGTCMNPASLPTSADGAPALPSCR